MKIINHPEETIIKPQRDEYIYEVGDVVTIRGDLDRSTMSIGKCRINEPYMNKTGVITAVLDYGYEVTIDGQQINEYFFSEDFIK